MSGAERSYRIALRAFPRQYREQRGEEIVSTILEGGDGWCPRLREFFGLLFAGVGQRSLRAGGEKTAGSVRAGIRLGAYFLLWLSALDATSSLVHFHNHYHGHALDAGSAIIGFLVLLTLSRGWWAAPITLVLAWEFGSAARWLWNLGTGSGAFGAFWVVVLLPALLCLLAKPRKQEPRDLRSPLWAIAAPALGALMGWQWQAHYMNIWVGLLFIALLATWFVFGWRDLRLAIAATTIVAFFGLDLAFSIGPTMAWNSPAWLMAYALFVFAIVPMAIGFGGRRVNA